MYKCTIKNILSHKFLFPYVVSLNIQKETTLLRKALPQDFGGIHSGELPGENLVRKITPRRKTFGSFTSSTIFHNFVHPEENIESIIVPSNFWILPWWVLMLPLWYFLVLGVWQRLIRITAIWVTFPPEY